MVSAGAAEALPRAGSTKRGAERIIESALITAARARTGTRAQTREHAGAHPRTPSPPPTHNPAFVRVHTSPPPSLNHSPPPPPPFPPPYPSPPSPPSSFALAVRRPLQVARRRRDVGAGQSESLPSWPPLPPSATIREGGAVALQKHRGGIVGHSRSGRPTVGQRPDLTLGHLCAWAARISRCPTVSPRCFCKATAWNSRAQQREILAATRRPTRTSVPWSPGLLQVAGAKHVPQREPGQARGLSRRQPARAGPGRWSVISPSKPSCGLSRAARDSEVATPEAWSQFRTARGNLPLPTEPSGRNGRRRRDWTWGWAGCGARKRLRTPTVAARLPAAQDGGPGRRESTQAVARGRPKRRLDSGGIQRRLARLERPESARPEST